MDQLVSSSRISIAFRTDASVQIGTGHLMRCLTLADALGEQGANCLFLCRPQPGQLMEQVAARGHKVLALSVPTRLSTSPEDPVHAAWLGAKWETDAAETFQALQGLDIDWLVVDHYALDYRWERSLRSHCRRLLVMDDLADRVHDCELLLDPTLGRERQDYQQLISAETATLLGPQYALLRPEFAQLRQESLALRSRPSLQRLLITMGGVDKDNATESLLDALDSAALPETIRITVVMGFGAPWLQRVHARAAQMRNETEVRVGVQDMARLMTDSDLAIGAAGGTSWERCCVGLPAFVICLADNQFEMARSLQDAGAIIATKSAAETAQRLIDLCAFGEAEAFLLRSSEAAARVTDGRGVERVCARMMS